MPCDSLHTGNLQLQVPLYMRNTNFRRRLSPYKIMFIQQSTYSHQTDLTVSETDRTQLINYDKNLGLNE